MVNDQLYGKVNNESIFTIVQNAPDNPASEQAAASAIPQGTPPSMEDPSSPPVDAPVISDWLADNNINLCLWNCRSIVNKLKEFQAFIQSSHFLIFAITESWCSPSIFDNEIIPPDYIIFRNDRDSRGGGVFIAVHKLIPSRLISSPSALETVTIEILLPHPVTICTTYIPPNASSSSVSSNLSFISSIIDQHPNTIL